MISNVDPWGTVRKVAGDGCCVMAVDPGGVTGICWAIVPYDVLEKYGVGADLFSALKDNGVFGFSQVSSAPLPPNPIDNVLSLESAVASRLLAGAEALHARSPYGLTNVVIEDFVLRIGTQSRDLLSPVRITSALWYALYMHGDLKPVVNLKQVSDAKGIVNDDTLKRFGLWFEGKQHARDAARHLVLALRNIDK